MEPTTSAFCTRVNPSTVHRFSPVCDAQGAPSFGSSAGNSVQTPGGAPSAVATGRAGDERSAQAGMREEARFCASSMTVGVLALLHSVSESHSAANDCCWTARVGKESRGASTAVSIGASGQKRCAEAEKVLKIVVLLYTRANGGRAQTRKPPRISFVQLLSTMVATRFHRRMLATAWLPTTRRRVSVMTFLRIWPRSWFVFTALLWHQCRWCCRC